MSDRQVNDMDEHYRRVERICCMCDRPDANYEAWGHFYCDRCNEVEVGGTCLVDHSSSVDRATGK